MPLVTSAELLRAAEAGGYAVGAFNCNNLEILQAILAAAEAERSPVIVQTSQGALQYAGLRLLAAMIRTAAEEATVPVALHLDHGTDFAIAVACLRAGYTSLMFDGSKLPYAENAAATRRIVEMAHAVGVSVEGELGTIAGTEDMVSVSEQEALYTDPAQAESFARETGVDALAVAVGTAHGVYRREPHLDFRRLEAIRRRVPVPLVLHGSSGVPDDQIREAVRHGVRKINIDTELRQAFSATLRSWLPGHPDEIDPRKILAPARQAMQAKVQEKMRLFGSSGRA
ncbi:MAG: class II fructose-1,6-bisphosphate aldolase [Firmicutes bacterium]|nr:class II fructose-1,6-bisphosphate aldolase [Bacillota bacterium]